MKSLLRFVKPLCLTLVICFMAWGVWSLRATLSAALVSAHWGYLAGAALIAAVYLLLNATVWGLVCRMVGADVTRAAAARLWIECEAMRWLPGGIWGYASRVIEARRLGMNKVDGSLSLALELGITVISWAVLGGLGFLCSPDLRAVFVEYVERFTLSPFLIAGMGVVVGGGLVGVILMRQRLLASSLRLRQTIWTQRLTAVRALGEYVVLNTFYSVGFLCCLMAISVTPLPSLLAVAGAYGLSWIVGLFAIGAPGGMGVREGFLYLVFVPLGIGTQVVTAAILWRALQILVELLLLAMVKLSPTSEQGADR